MNIVSEQGDFLVGYPLVFYDYFVNTLERLTGHVIMDDATEWTHGNYHPLVRLEIQMILSFTSNLSS